MALGKGCSGSSGAVVRGRSLRGWSDVAKRSAAATAALILILTIGTPGVARPGITTPSVPDGGTAHHASFDCEGSHGSVATAICRDRTLAKLDRTVAERFAALDRKVDASLIPVIHHDQISFLNDRQLCGDRECLVALYTKRLDQLSRINY